MRLPQDPGDLSRLADIVGGAPPPTWPPAPGWFALAVVIAVAAAWGGAAWLRRWRRSAYRRAALAELAQLEQGARVQGVPELLKRTALAAYPRDQVAALSGEPWLVFLDRTGGDAAFGGGAGRTLLAVAYAPGACERLDAGARTELFAAARAWIGAHRR